MGFILFIVLLGWLYQCWQFCLPCNWWQQLTRRTNKFYWPKYNHQLNKDLIINYAPMFSALHYSDNNKSEISTWIPCDLMEIEPLMIINEISSYRWVHIKKNARSSLISRMSLYEIFQCLGTFNAFRRKWMEIGNQKFLSKNINITTVINLMKKKFSNRNLVIPNTKCLVNCLIVCILKLYLDFSNVP